MTSPAPRRERAVVIGGSVAGVLAAHVLAGHYDEVVVLDRDDIPGGPEHRGGVPQGRHAHGLLARGRLVIDELVPGTTEALVGQGARLAEVGRDGVWCFTERPLASFDSDMRMLMVSRPLLEWHLRDRLVARPGVEVREDTSVIDLAFSGDGRRVAGVVLQARDGLVSQVLTADLVVDATGRASRTPEWLSRRGYLPPYEEVRRVDKRYATRRFRSDPDLPAAAAVAAQPGLPRGGVMLQLEGGAHVVSLAGFEGTRPPVDLIEFRGYARSLANPVIGDLIEGLTPLEEATTYRFPANRRRRYERLARFPDGLVVTGDALCAFDPVYGQGMTVAALAAQELERVLAEPGPDLSRRFHAQVARHVDTPWSIAAGGVPDQDARVPVANRVLGSYLPRLLRAGADDPGLAHAFQRVSHLMDPPITLLAPTRVARVLRASLGSTGRGAASPGPSVPTGLEEAS